MPDKGLGVGRLKDNSAPVFRGWCRSIESPSSTDICYFLFAFIAIALACGLVFGWPSLRRHLQQKEDTQLDEAALGLIFTVGAWSTQSSRLAWGIARDRFGTRRITSLAMVMATAGCVGLALCDANNVSALSISMFFVGTGSGVQLCLQPVAGLFDQNLQGLVLASLSGAFQVSGLVFVGLTAIPAARSVTFGVFAASLLVLTAVAFFILPDQASFGNDCSKEDYDVADSDVLPDTTVGLRASDSSTLNQDADNVEEQKEETEPALERNDVARGQKPEEDDSMRGVKRPNKELPEKSVVGEAASDTVSPPAVKEQLKSIEYILLVSWFSILLIPLQYYVGTIGYQLEQLGDDDGTYTRLFNVLFASAAGVAPFLGLFTDYAGLGVAQGVSSLMVAGSLVMLSIQNLHISIHSVGLALYGVSRMTVFAAFFTNVGKRFGYGNYGTLTGLGLLLSGLASLLQYPLIAVATRDELSLSDAGKVNVACAVVAASTLPYCIWLAIRERQITG